MNSPYGYDTVKALQKRADNYFAKASQGDRSLNQYKGFIYQGKARLLESTILNEEGNRFLADRTWKEAQESFELAADRATGLGGNYHAQAIRLLNKMSPSRGRDSLSRKRRDPKRPGFYVQAPLSGYREQEITSQARWALGLGRNEHYPNNPETLYATLPSGMKVRLLPKPARREFSSSGPRRGQSAHRTTDRLQAYCEYCGKWFGTGNIAQHQIVHGVGSERELQRYEQVKAKGYPVSLKRHRESVAKRARGSSRDYGDKRDYRKIDVFEVEGNGSLRYLATTTWSKTLKDARERFAKSHGISASRLKSFYHEKR